MNPPKTFDSGLAAAYTQVYWRMIFSDSARNLTSSLVQHNPAENKMEPIVRTIVIQRPIEEVFELATCLLRCKVWRTGVVAAEKLTPGPAQVGSQYKHKIKFLGVTFDGTPTITVWDPPHRMAYEDHSGPVKYEAIFSFEPAAEGTQFTVNVSAEPGKSYMRFTDGLMHAGLVRQFDAALHSLKD